MREGSGVLAGGSHGCKPRGDYLTPCRRSTAGDVADRRHGLVSTGGGPSAAWLHLKEPGALPDVEGLGAGAGGGPVGPAGGQAGGTASAAPGRAAQRSPWGELVDVVRQVWQPLTALFLSVTVSVSWARGGQFRP